MDPFGNDSTDLRELTIEKNNTDNKSPLWKRLLMFFIILGLWVVIVVVIIITVYIPEREQDEKEDNKEEDNKKEENIEKYGVINSIFDIDDISKEYSLLGEEFNQTNIGIFINNEKINSTNYKFTKKGENSVIYKLYEKELSMDNMFKDISNLIKVEMNSDKDISITSMISSFENCKDLRQFSIQGFLTNSLKSMKKLFYNSHINYINITNFDTKNVEDMSYMFAYTDFDNFDFNEKATYINTENVKTMSHLFYGCENLQRIDISSFKTSNVVNMSGMFRGCISISELDLSNLNINLVEDISFMFYDMQSLKELKIDKFNTENVKNMSNMFSYNEKITELDLSNFTTDNVEDMSYMFSYCTNLKTLKISNFKTGNVKDMSGMFNKCYNIKSLDLTSFNTSNVLSMNSMFNQCYELRELNLESFVTEKCSDFEDMFGDLTRIRITVEYRDDCQNMISTIPKELIKRKIDNYI